MTLVIMRILISFYSPWWNAPAYYAITLLEGLRAAGHDVCFLGQSGTPAFERAQNVTDSCYAVPLKSVRPDRLMKIISAIKSVIYDFQPDVINAHSPQDFFSIYFVMRSLFKKIPIVRTRCDNRSVQNNPFNRYVYNHWVDHLIFPSEAARANFFQRIDVSQEKTSVIYSGLDIKAFSSELPEGIVRHQFGIDSSTPIIGIVCRLSPVKGHEYFLAAAQKVLVQNTDVMFVISGEDAQITLVELEDRAKNMNIEKNFLFFGKVSDPRMIIADVDIGVVTSQDSELICRVAAEFMALGKPVIATGINVLTEMVDDGVTGFISSPDDPQDMAERIIQLTADTEMRQKFGKAALERVSAVFDRSRLVNNSLSIFQKIVK